MQNTTTRLKRAIAIELKYMWFALAGFMMFLTVSAIAEGTMTKSIAILGLFALGQSSYAFLRGAKAIKKAPICWALITIFSIMQMGFFIPGAFMKLAAVLGLILHGFILYAAVNR